MNRFCNNILIIYTNRLASKSKDFSVYLANKTQGTPSINPLTGLSEGSPNGVIIVSVLTFVNSGITP